MSPPLSIAILVALSGLACAQGGTSPYPQDGRLTLSDVQAKGTHNSYHLEPQNPLDPSHRYSHAPLGVQLVEQGVRQFELDLHYRSDEGFVVFHLPAGVDEESTCPRFIDCLEAVRAWSVANRWHMPVLIWLEPKDDLDLTDPTLEPLAEHWPDLEAEILSVFPADRILTPDEVRGSHDTLPAALGASGWPTLGQLRGRIIFSLLDSGTHRDGYLGDRDNLEGRLLFVNASGPADPFAAMFKINNAQTEAERVGDMVRAGFVVTSNVDSASDADEVNAQKADDSLAAGAHYLSSDLPAPTAGHLYWLEIPDGRPARCNPVRNSADCAAADIELLGGQP